MNSLRHIAALITITALTGCVGDRAVPEGAQLLLPDAVKVNWAPGFNAVDDGVGALVPIDLMVFERSSGRPLDLVDLSFAPLSAGAELLAPGDITLASSDCWSCVWDASRDRYLDWRAGTSSAQTDEDGLARVYVWVDAFPVVRDELQPIEIAVSLAPGARAGGAFQILAD